MGKNALKAYLYRKAEPFMPSDMWFGSQWGVFSAEYVAFLSAATKLVMPGLVSMYSVPVLSFADLQLASLAFFSFRVLPRRWTKEGTLPIEFSFFLPPLTGSPSASIRGLPSPAEFSECSYSHRRRCK